MKKSVPERLRPFIQASIDSYGQHVLGVFPNADDPPGAWPFAYTIGNHQRGLSELLMVAHMSGGDFAFVLNAIGQVMRKQERIFHGGELVSIGGKFPLKIVTASREAHAEYTIQAGQFWGTEGYEVQQVLVPDQQGRYPGEPGCKAPYSETPIV